mmetsp:Transcript_38009/g.61765  ORF Transcript_38009/g.61765 Transcript_38009/m.61765 type:complete len:948 (-) Transcript_38009:100-2943(-)
MEVEAVQGTKDDPGPSIERNISHQQSRIEFVEKVLKKGDSQYDKLVEEIKGGNFEWLLALAKTASLIRPTHRSLSKAILGFNWQRSDDAARVACSQLLTNLATVHAEYLRPIFLMLVRHLNAQGGDEALLDLDTKVLEAMHEVLHATISKILRLRPTAGPVLMPILIRLFPQYEDSVIQQRLYVKNLLRITEYAPHLRDKILLLLIERLVALDVSAYSCYDNDTAANDMTSHMDVQDNHDSSGNDDDDDDQHQQQQQQYLQQGEEKPEEKKRGEAAKGGNDEKMRGREQGLVGDGEKEKVPNIGDDKASNIVSKLNAMMEIVMQYLRIVVEQRQTSLLVFHSLLHAFGRTILKSTGTRCVQHLLFYICNRQLDFAESFLRFLLGRIGNIDLSGRERSVAAAYLSGFLVRSRKVKQITCLHFFNQLVLWAHSYNRTFKKRESSWSSITTTSSSSNSSSSRDIGLRSNSSSEWGHVSAEDGAPHVVFYSVCQAVFYIFCCRHSIFASLRRESVDQITDLVASELNPLRYITPSVTFGIAESLVRLKIADCKVLLEFNRKFPPLHDDDSSAADDYYHYYHGDGIPPLSLSAAAAWRKRERKGGGGGNKTRYSKNNKSSSNNSSSNSGYRGSSRCSNNSTNSNSEFKDKKGDDNENCGDEMYKHLHQQHHHHRLAQQSSKTIAAHRVIQDSLDVFPFDPCPLEASNTYLEAYYRTDGDLKKERESLANSPLLSPGQASVIQSPYTAASSNSPCTLSPAASSLQEALSSRPSPSPTHTANAAAAHRSIGPTPPSSQSLPASRSSPFVAARGGLTLPSISLPPSAAAHQEAGGASGINDTVFNVREYGGGIWTPAASVSRTIVQTKDDTKVTGEAKRQRETVMLWARTASFDSDRSRSRFVRGTSSRNTSRSPVVSGASGMMSGAPQVIDDSFSGPCATPVQRGRSGSEGSSA